MVNVLNHANGFIVIDEKTDKLKGGDNVKFLPINWEFYTKNLREFCS